MNTLYRLVALHMWNRLPAKHDNKSRVKGNRVHTTEKTETNCIHLWYTKDLKQFFEKKIDKLHKIRKNVLELCINSLQKMNNLTKKILNTKRSHGSGHYEKGRCRQTETQTTGKMIRYIVFCNAVNTSN